MSPSALNDVFTTATIINRIPDELEILNDKIKTDV